MFSAKVANESDFVPMYNSVSGRANTMITVQFATHNSDTSSQPHFYQLLLMVAIWFFEMSVHLYYTASHSKRLHSTYSWFLTFARVLNVQNTGESLKSRIPHLCGEETAKHIRLFGKLRIKKTKLLASLTFLPRCRDHNTIPYSFITTSIP